MASPQQTGEAFSLEIEQQPSDASGGLPFSTQPQLCKSQPTKPKTDTRTPTLTPETRNLQP